MSNAIMLPIKGIYVKKILKGEKRFEFRKKLCKKDITHIYIYETAPVKKVVCCVEVIDKLRQPKEILWNITNEFSGIEKKSYDDYFSNADIACAYQLGNVEKFDIPKELKDFGIDFVPQSYVYVDVPK